MRCSIGGVLATLAPPHAPIENRNLLTRSLSFTGGCSVRTASPTISASSSSTTASVSGGRSVHAQLSFLPSDNRRPSNAVIYLQTSRSPYVMYPYLISIYGLGAGELLQNGYNLDVSALTWM